MLQIVINGNPVPFRQRKDPDIEGEKTDRVDRPDLTGASASRRFDLDEMRSSATATLRIATFNSAQVLLAEQPG